MYVQFRYVIMNRNCDFTGTESSVRHGRFTTVQKARWFHPVRREMIDVGVKTIRPEANFDLKVSIFYFLIPHCFYVLSLIRGKWQVT